MIDYLDDIEETETPVMELAPTVITLVINYFDSYMNDRTAVPDQAYKKAFFSAAVGRDDFLPEEIQAIITKNRNGQSQKEYLAAHNAFSLAFSAYLD